MAKMARRCRGLGNGQKGFDYRSNTGDEESRQYGTVWKQTQ